MAQSRALLLALMVGMIAALAAAVMPHPVRLAGVEMGDIGLPLAGLANVAAGHSPYEVRLRGHTPALYPFPTMVVLWPLTLVPLPLAVPLFNGISSAALAYAVARRGQPWQLLIFLSPSYWSAMYSVQWSPLLTAAILLPSLLPLAVVKPQLGIVLLACGRWSRWTVAGALALVLVSLLIWPSWPAEWIRGGNLSTFNGVSPMTVLPGVVLVGAVLAWRTREGRLLLALAAVVQRYLYDQLPLFLVAKTWRQMALLLGASWAMTGALLATGAMDVASGVQTVAVWRAIVVCMFLPALAIVLRNRRPDPVQLAGVDDVVAGGHAHEQGQ